MKSKLHICVLQIGMTRNIGGLETYLMQQFEHISKKIKYDFVNITGEYEIAFKDKIIDQKSEIYNIPSRHKNPILHYWKWIKLLNRYGNKYKFIVLNCNSLEYVYPIFIAKLFGIPNRIIHSHNAGFENKISLKRKILIVFNKILIKYSATDYWACSKLAGEWMFGKKRKFKVIHNAIDVDKFKFNKDVRDDMRKQLNIKDDQFVVGHVGRFSYQKNQEFAVDIFYELEKIHKDAVLLLIGKEDQDVYSKVIKKVNDLKIDKKVKVLGIRDDIPALYQPMDCFVLPSLFEGLLIMGVEAQVSDLYTVFSDAISEKLKLLI